jgi:polysaccharide deacetylase 2 family uncharacterized protein YibQ
VAAGDRWAGIGDGLRRRYRDMVGDDGPSEDDVREALQTLGNAARSLADSIGVAMRDPDVRRQVKDAAASLVAALGTTFDELAVELRRTYQEEQE